MANNPFLYGELNKQVEYLRYKFQSTDGTLVLTQDNKDNVVDMSVNTSQLVTLKQVKKDGTALDAPTKYYRLYGYNSATRSYDIRLGDEIVVNTSIGEDITSILTDAWIKVGENAVFDETGNQIYIEDEFGNKIPLMEPVYQKIETTVDVQTGRLKFASIPVSALTDTYADGSVIESIIDANSKGVY